MPMRKIYCDRYRVAIKPEDIFGDYLSPIIIPFKAKKRKMLKLFHSDLLCSFYSAMFLISNEFKKEDLPCNL